jgi:RNA polymerase sigma factor (sigma-70 family)
VFRAVRSPATAELQALVQQLAERIGRLLQKRSLIERDAEYGWLSGEPVPAGSLDELIGHRITWRIALGPRAGQKVVGFMLEGSGLYAEVEPVSQGTDPYAHREVAELQRVLLALVEALPEQERMVIRYHYYQRMTVEQIGALLGVTKGRVSQVHRQALRRLREAYALATRIDLQL